MPNTNITEAINSLPSISETVEKFELWATKSLGQNFIFDSNITSKIARSGNIQPDDIVLEVGAGPGGLTRELIKNLPKKVIALELDKRALPALEELTKASSNILQVLNKDALKIRLEDLSDSKINIISNLPYNIGTKLLTNWLNEIARVKSITIMLQKEVAERICAKPRTKEYGRLSVLCQYYCYCNKMFDVPKECFIPAPKVTSSIVNLQPKENLDNDLDLNLFKEIISLAFNQRRKMLKVNLKKKLPQIEQILNDLEISPTARAEELSVEDFVRLTKSGI